MARRSRDPKRTSEWRRSWVVVLAACSGFAVASLQPSVTVAPGHDVELVSARGPDFELPQDELAALSWLADAGLFVDESEREIQAAAGDEASSSPFWDMIERALAEMNGGIQPDPTPTTQRPATTTTQRPATTTTQRPATTTTESAAVQAEQRFVQLINQERAAAGLPALAVHVDIRAVARSWSEEMSEGARGCSTGQLRHNPDYASQMPRGWTRVAENVACGQSVDSLHRLLMSSSGHRANILGRDFTHVGVGVSFDAAGDMWVTQNFAQYPAG